MKYLVLLYVFFWIPGRAQRPLLAVRWSFVGNRYGPLLAMPGAAASKSSVAELSVVSRGGAPVPTSGWKIYFNSNMTLDTASEAGELRIRHLNGDLFCMEPVGGVAGRVGGELRVRYVSADLSINVSDAPNGFFFVSDRAPEQGYPLDDYVVGRIDDEKLRPLTPAIEYVRNARITDIPVDRLPLIFPTPVSCRVAAGRLRLRAGLVIAADTAFLGEANYLAEMLTPVLGRRPSVTSGASSGAAAGRAMTSGRAKSSGRATSSRPSGPAMIVLAAADMDSSGYALHIGREGVRISAGSAEGVFYGVQSLLDVVGPAGTLPMLDVRDRPRFAYRGLMVDVARNFRGPRELRRILDLMAVCKLNVLHLHLTDDEGWRLEIPGLPELVSVGAKRGWPDHGMLPPSFGSGPLPMSGYYSWDTFVDLLRYARDRHVQVIPEIECPGHARSAVQAMDVRYASLTRAGSGSGSATAAASAAEYLLRDTLDRSIYESSQGWNDNIVCPGLPSVYHFMDKVVSEIVAMYHAAGAPLSTIHFGGDEVPTGVWEGSPACRELAGARDPAALRRYCWSVFYSRLDSILAGRGLALSGWEEAALPGKQFNIYVWDNMIGGGNEDLPYRLANAGHKVVLACVSNNYYDLAYERVFEEPGYHWGGFINMERPFSFIPYDYYRNSTEDWQGDPVSPGYFNSKEKLSMEGRRNILGIEGLLWGENLISDERFEYMLLPKLLGTAERAWTPDPGWGTATAAGVDESAVAVSYDSAWDLFVNSCGKRLLPRLARLDGGYAYRIPSPGVVCRAGRVWANCSLPGFTIRYTTDGSEPTMKSTQYTSPLAIKSGMRLKVFDGTGRGGRTVAADNKTTE